MTNDDSATEDDEGYSSDHSSDPSYRPDSGDEDDYFNFVEEFKKQRLSDKAREEEEDVYDDESKFEYTIHKDRLPLIEYLKKSSGASLIPPGHNKILESKAHTRN